VACKGALTSIVMTAAGSFVTNGGLTGVFGPAPISSAGGSSLLQTVTSAGGSTMSSASSLVQGALGTTGQSWYSSLSTTLTSMKDSVIQFTGPMRAAWNTMANAPVAAGSEVFMQTVGTFGPKTAGFLSSLTETAFQTALDQGVAHAAKTLGGPGQIVAGVIVGDPKILGSTFAAAQSYVNIANNFINAADNVAAGIEKTFVSLDNTITGAVDGVSQWAQGFGGDLSKLGETISWDNIANLGSPGQLLSNLENNGTLGPLYERISNISITDQEARQLGVNVAGALLGQRDLTIRDLGIDINAIAREGANLPAGLQKQIYQQLETLTPVEVGQVKAILNNTQAAIQQGSDLLDPTKLFAESFDTLTAPLRTASVGYRAIYSNDTGALNPLMEPLGDNLKGIIPDDLASANAALARSFGQIKGIQNTTTESFAEVTSQLENLKDLPLIQNQTAYLDPAVAEYWRDMYNQDSSGIVLGTGNLNTLVLSDIIGFAAGYNSGQPFVNNVDLLTDLNSNGDFDEFTEGQGIYETIQEFCDGTFGPTETTPGNWDVIIPAGWAAAGTYGPFATPLAAFEDAWINGIVPYTVLANVDIVQNSAVAQQVYNNDIVWQEQYGREVLNRQRMDLDVDIIQPSNTTAIAFAENLVTYGQDASFGGAAMWLERAVNIDSLGGQAVIAAMREGRNIQRLSAAGIDQDAAISTDGLEYPGDLVPDQYTKDEALAQVVRS